MPARASQPSGSGNFSAMKRLTVFYFLPSPEKREIDQIECPHLHRFSMDVSLIQPMIQKIVHPIGIASIVSAEALQGLHCSLFKIQIGKANNRPWVFQTNNVT